MRSSVLTLSLLVTLAACRESKVDESAPTTAALAEDGTDANELESHASALTAATTLATSAFDQPIRAAIAGVATTKSFFIPSTCVTSSVDRSDPSTITHTFDACSGPWGLIRISGKVTVKYSETTLDGSPALKLEVTGDALQIKKATADFHATAIVGGSNGGSNADRKMTYTAQLSGTSARGRALSRTVNWTQQWKVGEQCLTLDGTTDGTVAARSVKTTVEHFQRCRNACPGAGGVVTIENTKAASSLRIEFDGTANALVKSSDGSTTSVGLACGL